MDRLWRSNSSISSRTGCPLGIVNSEDHKVESCGATVSLCLHDMNSKILKNNTLSMADASLNNYTCFNYYSNASCLYRKRDNDKTIDPNFTPIDNFNYALASNAVSLPPLWYQSHSFLAGDSVVVFLCLSVCVYPKLWCSVVVSPSYRRWCHPSRKVNS